VWPGHKGRKGVYGQAKGQSGAEEDGLSKEEDIKYQIDGLLKLRGSNQ
jgi:hypothetical protein